MFTLDEGTNMAAIIFSALFTHWLAGRQDSLDHLHN
jgi:hypothetical protein